MPAKPRELVEAENFNHSILKTELWKALLNPDSEFHRNLNLGKTGVVVVDPAKSKSRCIHFKSAATSATPDKLLEVVKKLAGAGSAVHETDNAWIVPIKDADGAKVQVRRSFAKPGWHVSIDVGGNSAARALAEQLRKELEGKIDFKVKAAWK